jgi:hypothetical protein
MAGKAMNWKLVTRIGAFVIAVVIGYAACDFSCSIANLSHPTIERPLALSPSEQSN